jgi:MFS superfamily sulfate permease-like transporter
LAAGALGGLPITAVIVRSSANIDAGAHTKLSAVVHGALLLLSVLVLSPLLAKIPLAALAAVLIVMGVKLTSVRVFRDQRRRGSAQFIPFIVTLAAILLTDLLFGVLIGVAVGIVFVIRSNFQSAVIVTPDGNNVLIRFAKDVSFLNKPALLRVFADIEPGMHVLIDGTRAQFIDHDIADAIDDFVASGRARGIAVDLRRSPTSLNEFFKESSP